jgi:hypothetical protein
MLDPIKIEVHAEDAPFGAAKHRIEQMATNKTTAADNGHGEASVIEPRVHYSVTWKVPEFAPLFWRL